MFNNRDLIIMGVGAALAIFCLFLPIPFILKAVVGGLLLLASMVIALLRLGPDRVPLETWALRRWRFRGKARRYTYHQPSQAVHVAMEFIRDILLQTKKNEEFLISMNSN